MEPLKIKTGPQYGPHMEMDNKQLILEILMRKWVRKGTMKIKIGKKFKINYFGTVCINIKIEQKKALKYH